MLFNKLLYKLNLITETEYNETLISYINDDDDELSYIDGLFIMIFFATLYICGCIWMNII